MSDESTFQLVGFGADLLGSYYTARSQQASILSLPPVQSNVSLSSGSSKAETPWQQDEQLAAERAAENPTANAVYRQLGRDYAALKNKDDFIDRRDLLVRNSDLDVDSKGLFILYNALKDLKTIADYAGDPRTTATNRAGIDAIFQKGFSQVKDFIKTEEFDELTLMFGEKKNGVTAKAGLGKKQYDYVGPIIHEGKVDATMTSFTGGETFTITITRKTSSGGTTTEQTENFNITVPVADEDRTMENLVAQINEKIKAIKTTDDDGEEVPLYNTRFFAEEIGTEKFGFRIKTDFSEEMTFSAVDTEPALYVTGTTSRIEIGTKQIDDTVPLTSYITKLADLDDVTATQDFHKTTFGAASEALLVPEKKVGTEGVDPLKYAAETKNNAIATDSLGNLYSVGTTKGRFANHLNTSETGDAFLNKYDASGELIWSRLIGSQGDGESFALTIDADDNVIIAGQADKLSKGVSNDPLATSDSVFDGQDTFVAKYDSVGTQQWLYLADTYGEDGAASVTTDADGHVYVTGRQNTLPASSTVSGDDSGYIMKLNGTNGSREDYIEIGSSSDDTGQSIAVAADGNIIVASHEDGNLILQKRDKDDFNNVLWSHDYGDLGVRSQVGKVVVEGSRIYVTGSSNNSLAGGGTELSSPVGGLDTFVLAIDDAGASASADWTKFIGSPQDDLAGSITVSGGKIYLAGTTYGDVVSGALQGRTDDFVLKIDGATGVTDWAKQLGFATEDRAATGVAFATLGSSVLTKLGLPIGGFVDDEKRLIETQTTARAGDYFYVKVNDFITRKIEIKQGDTYRTLANRINRASFRYLNAQVAFNSGTSVSRNASEDEVFDAKAIIDAKVKEIQNRRNGIEEVETFEKAEPDVTGNSLKIATKDGGRVEIIAGRGEKDALKKLGLEPTLVLSTEELFALDDEEDDDAKKIGGIFAFRLDDRFSVDDQRDARFVSQELDYAIGIVQSAFRSLTYDPIAEQLKKDALRQGNAGPPPPHLQKQLANYQDGLNRISAIVPASGGNLLV